MRLKSMITTKDAARAVCGAFISVLCFLIGNCDIPSTIGMIILFVLIVLGLEMTEAITKNHGLEDFFVLLTETMILGLSFFSGNNHQELLGFLVCILNGLFFVLLKIEFSFFQKNEFSVTACTKIILPTINIKDCKGETDLLKV